LNKPNNSHNNSHNNNNKRPRGRNTGRRPQNPGNRSFESNGPEVKVRGSASQICDKYLTLARDASSAGDRVRAESLLQHAEHYYRLVNGGDDARTENANQQGGARRGQGPGEVTVAGEMLPEAQAQDEQTKEQPQEQSSEQSAEQPREQRTQEQRPSRRERARSASTNTRSPAKSRARGKTEEVVEATGTDTASDEGEATVEIPGAQVVEAQDESQSTEGEAVVIAEPVHVAEPVDDDTAESEVA
jgi:hypothetical protein